LMQMDDGIYKKLSELQFVGQTVNNNQ
jgi:hypothetical protein